MQVAFTPFKRKCICLEKGSIENNIPSSFDRKDLTPPNPMVHSSELRTHLRSKRGGSAGSLLKERNRGVSAPPAGRTPDLFLVRDDVPPPTAYAVRAEPTSTELGMRSLWSVFSRGGNDSNPRDRRPAGRKRRAAVLRVEQLEERVMLANEVTVPDSYRTRENQILSIPVATGFLENDIRSSGTLPYLTMPTLHGTLTYTPNGITYHTEYGYLSDGSFVYAPEPNFVGIDRLTIPMFPGR
jgi:hypothetical protein